MGTMLGFGSSKKVEDGGPREGVVVHLHHPAAALEDQRRIVFSAVGQQFTAEGLCWHAAVRLQIKPISFHLFSLFSRDSHTWLASNDSITVTAGKRQNFQFRIRIKLSQEAIKKLLSVDSKAADYLYLQCRNDFVSNQFLKRDNENDLESEKCIGLGLIDAVCALVQNNIQPSQIYAGNKFHEKDFLPAYCIKSFSKNILNKQKLHHSFKGHVEEKYKSIDLSNLNRIKLQYILGGIHEYFPNYMEEYFPTTDLKEVQIKIFHLPCPGVYCYSQSSQEELITSLEDIMDVCILQEQRGKVLVHRRSSAPQALEFRSIDIARSFVSLLEKSYRMLVDYHGDICKSVSSPMIMWMESIMCHGPVTGLWAADKIKEYCSEHPDYNYLLKQINRETGNRPGELWDLELVVAGRSAHQLYIQWHYSLAASSLKDCPCHLNLPNAPKFDRVKDLLQHYSAEHDREIKLKKCLRPSRSAPWDSKLYICRTSSDSHSSFGTPVLPVATQPQGVSVIFQEVHIQQHRIGKGHFTEVYTGTIKDSSGERLKVAVKQLNKDSAELLEMLTRAIHKAVFWSDSNIVHVHGICMAGPYQIVEEHAARGSLDRFLRQPEIIIKVFHLVMAARQIASALYYIHEKKEYHGNVRCRNVLVFHHSDGGIFVKLSDPGLLYHYNRVPMEEPDVSLERIPWLAPELVLVSSHGNQGNFTAMSAASDIYAFGMTLWEMFSSGRRPFHMVLPREIPAMVKTKKKPEKPDLCPPDLYAVMLKCWELDPDSRITSQRALRDIRTLELNADAHSYNVPEWDECQEVKENRRNQAQINNINQQFMQKQMVPLPADRMMHSPPDVLPVEPLPSPSSASQQPDLGLNGSSGNIQQRPLPQPPADELLIQHDRLAKLDNLGQGYYGEVFLMEYDDGQEKIKVAVKSLKAEMYDKCATEFEKEMKIMTRLRHENIVSVIGKCPQRDANFPMYIVMEFVEQGCLRDFLKAKKPQLRGEHLLTFATDVAAGMKYLSEQKVIHNDLAARNVLVTNKPWHAKISDFGLAKLLLSEEKDYYRQTPGKAIPAFWCAPEAIYHQKLSERSDVWSYSITLWEIYSFGQSPHLCKEASELVKKLYNGDRLPTSCLNCPRGILVLLKRCWEYKAENRPLFREIYDELKLIRV